MNASNVQAAIQQRSEKNIADLEKWEGDFNDAVISFLSSDTTKCLLIETRDSKLGMLRIKKLFGHLNENYENRKVIEKYLIDDNQTFLTLKQLLSMARPSERLPRFKNVLVCEYSNLLKSIEDNEERLNELIGRYNLTASKKVIFITSQRGSLDKYLKNIEMRGYLKIDEFNNKVNSMIYADETEAFFESTSFGHVNNVVELLKRGVNVNSTIGRGKSTALHIAAEKGYRDIVLILLRNGAKISSNRCKRTPLHLAAKNGHKDVALVLLENDVDVNIKNKWGSTALDEATFGGHNDVVTTLLEYDANINIRNDYGATALNTAVWKNNTDAVQTLLNYGADVDIKENGGDTALHLAVCKGNLEIVQLLIDRGANVNVRNNVGDTPLDLAEKHNYGDIVELLNSWAQ